MGRAKRLGERFKLIQQTLTELKGDRLAFAAASAAWLRAIQYAQSQALKNVQQFSGLDAVAFAAAGEAIQGLDAEQEAMLRGFHLELCRYLKVDPVHVLRLSKHFEQVVQDICFQGG